MTDKSLRLLVVDDDAGVVGVVERFAGQLGFDVVYRSSGNAALESLAEIQPELAIIDLQMPGVGGIDVLKAIRAEDPRCQTILMTGNATLDTAIEAVKAGALDYLTKPFDSARLQGLLVTVREGIRRRERLMAVDADVARQFEFQGMIGRSPAMQELFDSIRRLAPHVRTVLIEGETGTGKELVAKALHQLGPRQGKRFITVNCSAVVETLFESELFGHVRGAFTDAKMDRVGRFELADSGTLFLDEIANVPLNLQAKMLRALEIGEIERVGSSKTKRVDVRVISATNARLPEEVGAGRFREDLLFRLNTVEIHLPALRERREDISALASHFLGTHARRYRKDLRGFDQPAMQALLDNPWQGNVRELNHVIERAVLLAQDTVIRSSDLALRSGPQGTPKLDDMSLEEVEAFLIKKALARYNGNVSHAANGLGLSRSALYRRLQRYGL
jgi:DNA-binding NtrC family response regulator